MNENTYVTQKNIGISDLGSYRYFRLGCLGISDLGIIKQKNFIFSYIGAKYITWANIKLNQRNHVMSVL
jgi:hypothetical protein